MLFISEKSLYVVKKILIHKVDAEVCGFLLTEQEMKKMKLNEPLQENELFLFVDRIGKNIEGRHACLPSKYTKYMWHTHVGKAYPSIEDIIYPITKKYINNLLVFTKWGIWNITHKSDSTIDKERLEKVIEWYLDGLYYNSERGRGVFNEDIHEAIMHAVKGINKIRSHFPRFSLTFTPWNDIQDNYYILE